MALRWLLLVAAILTAPAAVSRSSQVTSVSLVREEQVIEVNGMAETWRLAWKSPPTPICNPEDDSSINCPCIGFAYGEMGRLDLVRIANGREIDRLELTPFFETDLSEQPAAVLPRWEFRDNDIENIGKEGFPGRVRARPLRRIIQFADYDHDRSAAEFFLQNSVAPCGKRYGIIVGLTREKPRLHVFASIANPAKPLVLQKRIWDALLKTRGPSKVLSWPCGDHGSEAESVVEIQATRQGIRAVEREYACKEDGKRGPLLKTTPL